MSLYAISDLHLSFGTDKPMSVFQGWENHTERLAAAWKRMITDGDTVVLAGDTSWALKLEEAQKDFAFINALPGKKIILKGNHDLWWPTVSKIKNFFAENSFDTIEILHNNSFCVENFTVCGSRGWLYDAEGEADEKIIRRECGRLEASLADAEKYDGEKVVFLHYPPVYGDFVSEEIFSIIKKHGIKRVYYGHIHGIGRYKTVSEYQGVSLRIISCDCVDFCPIFIG